MDRTEEEFDAYMNASTWFEENHGVEDDPGPLALVADVRHRDGLGALVLDVHGEVLLQRFAHARGRIQPAPAQPFHRRALLLAQCGMLERLQRGHARSRSAP